MHRNILAKNINTYFAAFLIALIGAGASLLIMRIAYAPVVPAVTVSANADAIQLQKSILGR